MIMTRPGNFSHRRLADVGGTEGQFVEIACGLDRSRWDVHLTCNRAVGRLRARIEATGQSVWSFGPGSFSPRAFALALGGSPANFVFHRIRVVHAFDSTATSLVSSPRPPGASSDSHASQRELGDPADSTGASLLSPGHCVWPTTSVVNAQVVARTAQRARAVAPRRIAGDSEWRGHGPLLARAEPTPTPGRAREPVGTLANLRPEKGTRDLVRAMALVRDRGAGEQLSRSGAMGRFAPTSSGDR